jgi:drug/metabolite transporter (DMT)-like permease
VAGARPTHLQAWSLAAVSLGVVAFLGTSLSRFGGAQLTGDLLLLAASLAWSAYGVLLRRWGTRPFATSALTAVLSAAAFLPLYGLLGNGHLSAAPLQEVLRQAVFQGVFIGVGSILVYSTSVAINGASATALAASAVPALTAAGAWLLLDERPAVGEAVGLVMVTAGVALGAVSQARPRAGAG